MILFELVTRLAGLISWYGLFRTNQVRRYVVAHPLTVKGALPCLVRFCSSALVFGKSTFFFLTMDMEPTTLKREQIFFSFYWKVVDFSMIFNRARSPFSFSFPFLFPPSLKTLRIDKLIFDYLIIIQINNKYIEIFYVSGSTL